MKKWLSLLLALCLLLTLASCGGDDDYNDDPIYPDDPVYDDETTAPTEAAALTIDDLQGVWYKDGKIGDEQTKLIIDGDVYYTEVLGSISESAYLSVEQMSAAHLGLAYTGPVLALERMIGIISPNLWILDGGRVIFDEFFAHFYVSAELSEDERAHLIAKYDIIRDAWCSKTNTNVLDFAFDGSVTLIPGDGVSESIPYGTWQFSEGKITLTGLDGTIEEIANGNEIAVASLGLTFKREVQW